VDRQAPFEGRLYTLALGLGLIGIAAKGDVSLTRQVQRPDQIVLQIGFAGGRMARLQTRPFVELYYAKRVEKVWLRPRLSSQYLVRATMYLTNPPFYPNSFFAP